MRRKYTKEQVREFEKAKRDKKCDCRVSEANPLIKVALMPDGSWHEPTCALSLRYLQLIR